MAADLSSLKIEDTHRVRRSTGKFFGIFAAVIGALLLISAAVFAFRNQTPVVQVVSAQAVTGPQATTLLNASGYITPRNRATVAAKITGRVTQVLFDEGMRVKKGRVLATLDDSDVQRALDSSKADRDSSQAAIQDYEVQLKYAQIELHRAEELQAAKVQSQEQLDSARTNAESLKAKIALAKQQVVAAEARIRESQQAVDNCVIAAPFDGIIVSKDAQVGEMVSPISAGGGFTRTGIATIVDMLSNEIEVDVNEAYIAKVVPHQHVEATLDAYPDVHYPSHVRTIIPSADRQKATVKVRITIDHLDDRILPDMGVKVAFLGDDAPKPKQAVANPAKAIIPKNVVHTDASRSFVWLVQSGKIEQRAVTLGGDRGGDVEVIAGVNPGDQLVSQGPENLKEGQKVEIRQ